MMKSAIKFCFVSSLLLFGCASDKNIGVDQADVREISLISPAGKILQIDAEIADTNELRTIGLMDRTKLSQGDGMLFIFENPDVLMFWMKNTLIPLDIIFFDEVGVFVHFESMDPCEEEPCDVFTSEEFALYALEVPAGYAQKMGIGTGWKLEL
jgi:uncharacterized protein